MELKLGFIGFGEAAYEIASGLNEEGLKSIYAYDPMIEDSILGSKLRDKARNSNVNLVTSPEEVVANSNVLIVAVPADKAFEVSQSIKPHLQPDSFYIEVSASSPHVKESIWKELKTQKIKFVDAAMMGPLTIYKHKVPMLSSGNGVDAFIKLMTPYGFNIKRISENPGDASAVKLIRSIYMKGTVALLYEMLEAADAYKVEELVLESLNETFNQGSFIETVNRLVTGTSIHAERRAKELEGTVEFLDSLNLGSKMTSSAREKLEWIANFNLKEKFEGESPKDWKQVIQELKKDREYKVQQ